MLMDEINNKKAKATDDDDITNKMNNLNKNFNILEEAGVVDTLRYHAVLNEVIELREEVRRLEIKCMALNDSLQKQYIHYKNIEAPVTVRTRGLFQVNYMESQWSTLKMEHEILEREKFYLHEVLARQDRKIEKLKEENRDQDKRIKKIEDENQKLKEASLVGDLLAELFRKFILKNSNDTYLKDFIKTEVYGPEANLPGFHKFLRMKKYENEIEKIEMATSIKNKFKEFSGYTYDYIQTQYYDKIVKPRNNNSLVHSNYTNTDFDIENGEREIVNNTRIYTEPIKTLLSILKG